MKRIRNKVKLDVGGQIFSTTLEVLTRYDSYFSSMFAVGHDQPDTMDGSYYIDRSPQYFDLVLEFLRNGELRSGKKLTKEEIPELLAEAEYYGIKEMIASLDGSGKPDVEGMTWDPNRSSPGINLTNNNMTATSQGGCSHKTVCGTIPITHGIVVWEVLLNQQADCYSAVGLVGATFDYQNLAHVGIAENSWGLGLYAGGHVDTSDRRIQVSLLASGSVVRSVYDADEKNIGDEC